MLSFYAEDLLLKKMAKKLAEHAIPGQPFSITAGSSASTSGPISASCHAPSSRLRLREHRGPGD